MRGKEAKRRCDENHSLFTLPHANFTPEHGTIPSSSMDRHAGEDSDTKSQACAHVQEQILCRSGQRWKRERRTGLEQQARRHHNAYLALSAAAAHALHKARG